MKMFSTTIKKRELFDAFTDWWQQDVTTYIGVKPNVFLFPEENILGVNYVHTTRIGLEFCFQFHLWCQRMNLCFESFLARSSVIETF